MNTRCKFVCENVTKTWNKYDKRFMYTAHLVAVMEGSEENKKFFAYTPVGELKLQSINQDIFQPGNEYYLDISESREVEGTQTA